MYTYLLNRRGHYHFRLRVPSDLSQVISSAELNKSLKTKDLKEAHLLARHYLQRIHTIFSLFRAGYLDHQHVKEQIDCVLGRTRNKPESLKATAEVPASLSTYPTHRLSSIISSFISDKQMGWSLKTKMENEASLRLLLDVIGDGAIENIDRKTASLLRDALCILPANVYKVLPGIPVSRVLEELKTGCSSHPPMSTTTVNKHLSRFSTLLAYCVREGILRSNPAEGMTLKRKRKADEERKAYSPQDLKMIFENLRYHDSEPERYWIPILSMYTGLRLDELCQLYTEDVTEYDGVHCISVADTQDKKVKTLSSRRIVPVHPRLVKLGFLAYVRKAKANGQLRLWMNLKRRDADGYGSAYGKVFQRFNRKYITNDPLKTFHSFRHTFANSLKQQGVQESLIAEILGHTNPSITTGRYGKRFQPRVLLEAIKKLEFELD